MIFLLVGAVVDSLFDLGALSDLVAQIIQLGASYLTAAGNGYGSDVGRMYREYLLDSDAVSYAADGKGLRNSGTALADNGSFKVLNTLVIAFSDLGGDSYVVSDIQRRDFSFKLVGNESLDLVVHE